MIRHLLKLVWNRKRSNALVIVEIFFSFLVVFAVVTAAASLILRWSQPLGFDWQGVWAIRFNVPEGPTDVTTVSHGGPQAGMEPSDDPRRAVVARIVRELRTFPQVAGVATAHMPPYSLASSEGRWDVRGRTVDLTRDSASDTYAQTMHLRVLRGRWFEPADDARNFDPIVIDSDLAHDLYGNEDPIGQKFDEISKREQRVVGVIAPYRKDGEFSHRMNMTFSRFSLDRPSSAPIPMYILVRVKPGTTAELEEQMAKRIHELQPDVSFRVRRMEAMRRSVLRIYLTPLIAAGIVALFLISMVTLGLTGVLWQNVTRRTREIGLRRALGASGGKVRGQIVAEVALLATLAVVIGVVVVVQLPILGLFHVVTPAAFAAGLAGSLAMIYGLTILCGVYPGWLASRVQPAQALHYE